jgi:ribose 5-phosphate isomerase
MNACIKALEFLPKKGKVGLGSGSTVDIFAKLIPTDSETEFFCVSKNALEILKKKRLKVSDKLSKTDIAFDGADSIVGKGTKRVAIKGAGALAFTDEKKLDYSTKRLVIMVDESKITNKRPDIVFVEVDEKYEHFFIERMAMFGLQTKEVSKNNPHLKGKKNKFLYITLFGKENLNELEKHIESVKGVKGSGIFSMKEFKLIIGNKKDAKVI